MNNNRRSLMAVVGPLVGVALLVLLFNYGLNYLRQAQDEAQQAARIQELVDRMGADAVQAEGAEVLASDAVTATEVATDTGNVTATEAMTAATLVTATGEVDAGGTVTVTDEVTGAADLGSVESVTTTVESVDASAAITEAASTDAAAPAGMVMGGMGMGRGMGGGAMRTFHMAAIPEEYAGTLSPVPAGAESIARGEAIFQQNCALCHGPTGLGDGVAAAGLNPAPPMIAMTSQMLGDDYMFWRISEGGSMDPFNSAMPTWKAILSEDQRWDVINYVRSLGAGTPAGQGGGPGMNSGLEAQMLAEMLAAGMDQGAITQEQADLFDAVHSQIDTLRAADPNRQFTGTMRNLQDQLLEELVAGGDVSQVDADEFNAVLALLEEAGLMQ